MDKSTVALWTKGAYPSSKYIVDISRFFDVSIEYLLTGEGSESSLEPEEQELIHKWRQLDDDGIIKGEMVKCFRFSSKTNEQNRADA